MRNPLLTAVALAGVLACGVGAAAINTQIDPTASAGSDVADVTLVASTQGYQDAGLVTDIAALEAYPAPVIEVMEVVDPALSATVTPKPKHRKPASSATSKRSHPEPSDDDDDDEAEDD